MTDERQTTHIDDTLTDKQFYEFTRHQIEIEDHLLNYRVTWLLTMHTFLFASYGFSLSAESTKLTDTIKHARTGLALMGVISPLIVLIGILAAAYSLQDLIKGWQAGRSEEIGKRYPQLLGMRFLGFMEN